ncbi:AAA family ATPase, partial [bacterium]|nr:AAA family ATPase [bacterium]
MLNKIRLNDFLSFGPEGIDLELRPLNVIIGPNASGKSNLIQALKILKSAPDKITDPFSEGGGTPEFLWKGKQWAAKDFAGIDVGIKCYEFFYGYKLCFSVDHFGQFKLRNEVINERLEHEKETIEVYYLKGKKGGPHYKGNSIIPTLGFEEDTGNHNEYDFNLNVPILKQFTDYTRYTEVDIIRRVLRKIQIYPGWPSGLEFKPRNPQPVDLDSKFLNDDASNLPGVINKFDNMPGGDKQKLVDCIQKIYPGIKNVTTDVIEHQLYLR